MKMLDDIESEDEDDEVKCEDGEGPSQTPISKKHGFFLFHLIINRAVIASSDSDEEELTPVKLKHGGT